jgi:hypothetical protein
MTFRGAVHREPQTAGAPRMRLVRRLRAERSLGVSASTDNSLRPDGYRLTGELG